MGGRKNKVYKAAKTIIMKGKRHSLAGRNMDPDIKD